MRTPLPHQQTAIDRLVKQGGRGGLGDEMGLGKSSVALWVMERMAVGRVTVVCPLSITHKWCDEVRDTIGVCAALIRNKLGWRKWSRECPVRVIHYEALATLDGTQLEELGGQGLIIDECHYAKNRTSLRSKAVRELAKRCRYVLCLTGTLVRNDVRDVWHPTELAVPGHLGSYAMFEARFAEFRQFKLPSMRRPVKQFRSARNEAELAKKLAEVWVRRKKTDVMDLPPKQRVVVPMDLDKESARIYREMKTRAMVELRGATAILADSVIARTALEQAIRLEQITNGIVGGGNLDEPAHIHESAKIEWTLNTIADLHAQGQSIAVFGKFNETLKSIQLRLLAQAQVKVFRVIGEDKAEARKAAIDEFRSGGGVILCQLRLSEGFDLTPCTYSIHLGIEWTPGPMDQAEDRLHRIGTTGQVTCYYPLMRKTIDERLYRVVMEKREDARRVLGDVAVMREELQAV